MTFDMQKGDYAAIDIAKIEAAKVIVSTFGKPSRSRKQYHDEEWNTYVAALNTVRNFLEFESPVARTLGGNLENLPSQVSY